MSSKKAAVSDETRTASLTNDGSFEDEYAIMDNEDENFETLSNADTFSLGGSASEGVSVYLGKESCTPWNISWSGMIVTSRIFKRSVIVMIVLNSVSIAMATMDWVRDYPDRKMAVFIVNALFRVLFTIELLLRFLYAGPRFFADGWCLFDLFIITSSWFVYPLLGFRMFRLVRALRLATRVKELQYLAKALLTSAPQMFCILFLLTIQFYIFTIVFTDLFKDLYKQGYTSEDYFSRLDITCFTLFQILTLDVWSEIAHEVMAVYPWAWFPFVFFIMTTTFFFLNLIIAVICEAVSKVGHERQINELKRQMGLPNADTDDSSFGSVSDAVKTDAKLSRVENKVDKLAQQVELLLLHHKTPKDAPS